jgi:hypothetical protein
LDQATIKALIAEGPIYGLAVVAVWCFFKYLPATIKAVGSFLNDRAKTKNQIKQSQERSRRALEDRAKKKGKDK